jgi:hypothetical protein
VTLNQAGTYTFLYGKGIDNHELDTGFFVHKRIVLSLKRVEFINDRIPYMILRSRCCDIIVQNVHAPTEDKIDDVKDSPYEELEYETYDNSARKYQCQSRQGNIFKPTIRNKTLQKISNDNGIRAVKFATSNNLIVKSTMFWHCNSHKFTWRSPDGKSHNHIEHILIGDDIQMCFMFDHPGERNMILTNIWR